jgi:hypothetical protein
MDVKGIVDYWRDQHRTDQGQWVHQADQRVLSENDHSFNLDFPVSPYVGNIVNAPVIILGANAGYHEARTPVEFPDEASIGRYLARVRDPAAADWQSMHQYYHDVNYGALLLDGRAAWLNVCAYRSRKISNEPINRRLVERLPSVAYARRWLIEAVMPLAAQGKRLVVAKRPGLWKLTASAKTAPGMALDPTPISPQVTREPWARIEAFLAGAGA